VELAARGAAACPKGSLLARGRTGTVFMGQFPSETVVEMFNNANEQIILAQSYLVTTVARGRVRPDNSIEYASPTCWPTVGSLCPVDSVLQLWTVMRMTKPYTKTVGGRVRTYMRTPRKCPAQGYWTTPVKFWWADGTSDIVATKQPCRRPG
jgi:hypothetical protein